MSNQTLLTQERSTKIRYDGKGEAVRHNMANGQVRCYFCNKMFFTGTLGRGTDISPRCPRCKKDNIITVL